MNSSGTRSSVDVPAPLLRCSTNGRKVSKPKHERAITDDKSAVVTAAGDKKGGKNKKLAHVSLRNKRSTSPTLSSTKVSKPKENAKVKTKARTRSRTKKKKTKTKPVRFSKPKVKLQAKRNHGTDSASPELFDGGKKDMEWSAYRRQKERERFAKDAETSRNMWKRELAEAKQGEREELRKRKEERAEQEIKEEKQLLKASREEKNLKYQDERLNYKTTKEKMAVKMQTIGSASIKKGCLERLKLLDHQLWMDLQAYRLQVEDLKHKAELDELCYRRSRKNLAHQKWLQLRAYQLSQNERKTMSKLALAEYHMKKRENVRKKALEHLKMKMGKDWKSNKLTVADKGKNVIGVSRLISFLPD